VCARRPTVHWRLISAPVSRAVRSGNTQPKGGGWPNRSGVITNRTNRTEPGFPPTHE
jgi:hypothetical protein